MYSEREKEYPKAIGASIAWTINDPENMAAVIVTKVTTTLRQRIVLDLDAFQDNVSNCHNRHKTLKKFCLNVFPAL